MMPLLMKESRHLFTNVLRKSGIIFPPPPLIRTLATATLCVRIESRRQRPNILIPSPQLCTTHRLPLRPVEMGLSHQAHGCCRTSRIIWEQLQLIKSEKRQWERWLIELRELFFFAMWNGKTFLQRKDSGGQLLSE